MNKLPDTFSFVNILNMKKEKQQIFADYFNTPKIVYCIGFLPYTILENTPIKTFLTQFKNKKEIKDILRNEETNTCITKNILLSLYPENIKKLFHPIKHKNNYEYLTNNYFYLVSCSLGDGKFQFQKHKTELFYNLYKFFEFKNDHFYIIKNGLKKNLYCSYDGTILAKYFSWSDEMGDNNWLNIKDMEINNTPIHFFLYKSLVESKYLQIIEFNPDAIRNPFNSQPKQFSVTLDEDQNPIVKNL